MFDCWQFILMPVLFLGLQFKKYFNILIANILLFSFQATSMYIKNISFGVLDGNSFIGMIYSIDVLIMVILYFAYANINKKEKGGKE